MSTTKSWNLSNTAVWHLSCAMLVLLVQTKASLGFVIPTIAKHRCRTTPFTLNASADASPSKDDDDESSSSPVLFPVLRKIAGMNWEGSCRYVNENLVTASFELTGGIRFDLGTRDDDDQTSETDLKDNDADDDYVEMNSFIVFPNGKSREIKMSGNRGPLNRPSMRLVSSDSDAPIYTVITELDCDTILINEIDKGSGRIVMSSSLSLVTDYTVDSTVVELIQVSHEVAAPKTNPKSNKSVIEGHQVWRFHRKKAYQ